MSLRSAAEPAFLIDIGHSAYLALHDFFHYVVKHFASISSADGIAGRYSHTNGPMFY